MSSRPIQTGSVYFCPVQSDLNPVLHFSCSNFDFLIDYNTNLDFLNEYSSNPDPIKLNYLGQNLNL